MKLPRACHLQPWIHLYTISSHIKLNFSIERARS